MMMRMTVTRRNTRRVSAAPSVNSAVNGATETASTLARVTLHRSLLHLSHYY